MLRQEEIDAENILEKSTEMLLSSVSTDGNAPRSSIISKIMSEGFGTIYFAAPESSQKVQNLKLNPNASICYFSGSDSITLLGQVEIIKDDELIKKVWDAWCNRSKTLSIKKEEFCAMRFVTTEATFLINGNLSTYTY